MKQVNLVASTTCYGELLSYFGKVHVVVPCDGE